MKKRLIIDLDGTICTQMKSGDYHLAQPRPAVIARVNQLWTEGWDVVVFTARGMNTCRGDVTACDELYREMTERWLKENRVCYTELIFGKPAGDLYVDDKGTSIDDFAAGNF